MLKIYIAITTTGTMYMYVGLCSYWKFEKNANVVCSTSGNEEFTSFYKLFKYN